jgi:oligopeptide transport system ATP-binding protein
VSDEIAIMRDIRKTFRMRAGHLSALDGVDLVLRKGECVGLVGESGSGKTTLARILMGIERPSSGMARLWGADPNALNRAQQAALRRKIGVVFQDPFSSLNPKLSLERIIAEPLEIHRVGTRATRAARVSELLEAVGLDPGWAGRRATRLSGGQRQRVAIARAIALEPELLILDEPVSGLDVSVQAQVLNLLAELRERLGFTTLFISHDLAVVRHVADRVAVMYLGRVVEEATTASLFDNPQHPYTCALLSSIFDEPGTTTKRIVLEGDPPSPLSIPTGCRFRTRCFAAQPACSETDPSLREIYPGQRAACLFPGGTPANSWQTDGALRPRWFAQSHAQT